MRNETRRSHKRQTWEDWRRVYIGHVTRRCGKSPRLLIEDWTLEWRDHHYGTHTDFHSDLRAELPLPPSQLAEIDYPPVLPPPPENFEKVMGFESGSVHGSALNDAQLQLPKSPAQLQSMENVWLYYMTDIIMSRLKNHVLKTLYDEGPVSWNPPNLFSMLSTVNEYEYKLRHWYADNFS